MTGPSQAFQIGQEVEITDPGRYFGIRFVISQIQQRDGGSIEYTKSGVPWCLASSLRLVEPELKIGDWVEVVGPASYFSQYNGKTKFQITKGPYECRNILGFGVPNCGDWYGGDGTPFYPASSLRLVEEELKIGDWVMIDNPEFKSHGEIFQISGVLLERTETYLSDAPNKRHFAECHLRKLLPDEVQAHLASLEKKPDINVWRCWTDKRLAAIEKRQATMEERQKHMGAWIDETNSRMCQATIRRQF